MPSAAMERHVATASALGLSLEDSSLRLVVLARNLNLMEAPCERDYISRMGDFVANTSEAPFHFEVESSVDSDLKMTTVRCHGRLVNQTAGELKDMVKPLITEGGSIVLDLTDVSFMDSLGLGTLVGLKVSAIHQGFCTLTVVNLTPRIQELLKLTNLTKLFAS
jgi:anti-sigma B factor antagonist